MKARDLILIAISTAISLPLVYIVVLLATGQARVEFGPRTDELAGTEELEVMKDLHRQDSLMVEQSKTFQALVEQKRQIEAQKQVVERERQALELLRSEIEAERKALEAERIKIESAVKQTDELSAKLIKQTAKIYTEMKANEAAQILETLSDKMVIDILKAMNDNSQKAKIVASMSRDKASRVTKQMSRLPQ